MLPHLLALIDTGADSSRIPLEQIDETDIIALISQNGFAIVQDDDEEEEIIDIVTMAEICVSDLIKRVCPIHVFNSTYGGQHQLTPSWIVGRKQFLDLQTVTFVGVQSPPVGSFQPGTIVWHNY
mmetsp:Transcript_15418/g.21495  ORF Transcript_15418/g.21495 Transcript_15418/m.21495 type:complete len:124 (-) Transcript_15418:230-601(-)